MKLVLTSIVIFFYCSLIGQNYSSLIIKKKFFYNTTIPQFIELSNSSNLKKDELKSFFKDVYGFDLNYKLISETKDNLGFLHSKYQQEFAGINVEYGVFYVHSKKGFVKSINGFIKEEKKKRRKR